MRYALVLLLLISCSKTESPVSPPPPKIDGTWKQIAPSTSWTIVIFQDSKNSIHGTGYANSCQTIPSVTGTFSNPNVSLTMDLFYNCSNTHYSATFVGVMDSDTLKGNVADQYWVWVRQK